MGEHPQAGEVGARWLTFAAVREERTPRVSGSARQASHTGVRSRSQPGEISVTSSTQQTRTRCNRHATPRRIRPVTATAAIAANRFGLGARPGEIADIGSDPHGWLKQQITRPVAIPAPIKDLPTSAKAIESYQG